MELGSQTSAAGALTGAPDAQHISRLAAVTDLHESPLNPRKTFDKQKLEELAQSMRAIGVLEPLVGRVSPWEHGKIEIIAGARRYRAAKLAGLLTVPLRTVQMTEAEVIEAMVIENSQREDVAPLEEAEGFRSLMNHSGQTANQIADKIGMSRETVYARLKLLDAMDEVRAALAKGVITPGHAILMARLQPRDQKEALKQCVSWRGETISVRQLDDWIEQHVRLPLEKAPFDLKDAKLGCGACAGCEKRDAKRCFDPGCYHAKTRALVERKRLDLTATGKPFVSISDSYGKAPKGSHARNEWREAPAGETGPKVTTALVVDGSRAGKVIHVKLREAEPSGPAKGDRERDAARAKQKADREREVRGRILDAILDTVKAPLERDWLDAIAGELVDQAIEAEGSDALERLWPELKMEGKPWRAAREARAKAIAEMKPQSLARLLVACTLSHECDCGLYGAQQTPEALLAAAKRSKVNVEKIRAKAEADLKKGPAEKKLEDLGLLPKMQTAAKAGAK